MIRGLRRLLRLPVVHFLVLGGLLFAADAAWQTVAESEPGPGAAEKIVVTAAQVEQLRRDLTAQFGIPPSEGQLLSAVEAAIDEEVLYREALALGLDRNNAAVRQRLVQIARFVAEDPDQEEDTLYQAALRLGLDRSDLVVRRQLATTMRLVAASVAPADEAPPGDVELEAYLNAHSKAFEEPLRMRLSHVYFSDDRRGPTAEADALRLLGEARAEPLAPDDGPVQGDPFLHGHHLPWQTELGLRRRFGAAFADAVVVLSPGVWSGPVRSSYGWHLVWVHAIRPPTVPPLAEVRERVLRAVLEERRERRVRQALEGFRSRYVIEVETAAGARAAADHGADG